MPKLTLTDIANLESETSVVTAINNNSAATEAAVENTLSRDGTAPNAMNAVLDMGIHRVINIATPIDDNDAVRLVDLRDVAGITSAELQAAIDAVAEVEDLRDETVEARDDTFTARDEAAASAAEAAEYIGSAVTAQALTTPRTFTYTGNVTGGPTAFDGSANVSIAMTIPNDTITNAKLNNVSTNTIKGRITASTGDPEDLTPTQVTSMLNNFVGDSGSGGTKGLVPAPATGDAAANKFLKASGAWAEIPAASVDLSTATNTEETLTTYGSVKLGGLIIKWGTHFTGTSSAGNTSLVFISPFPNTCLNLQLTTHNSGAGPSDQDSIAQIITKSASGATLYMNSGNGGVTQQIEYLAIGY